MYLQLKMHDYKKMKLKFSSDFYFIFIFFGQAFIIVSTEVFILCNIITTCMLFKWFFYIVASSVYHLWEFIRDLLHDPTQRIIKWENEQEGIFRVVKSSEVAKQWGNMKKNREKMTYEKLSRSLRYLYVPILIFMSVLIG